MAYYFGKGWRHQIVIIYHINYSHQNLHVIITVHLFIINNKKIEFFFKGGQIQATLPAYLPPAWIRISIS